MLGVLLAAALVSPAPMAVPASTYADAVQVSATQTKPDQPWPPAGVSRPGGQVTTPKLIHEVKPAYTTNARKARIEGDVVLEAIVQPDGKVGEVRVVRSLDKEHGLDQAAVNALRQWRFEPGKKDGKAVAVLVEVEMTFTVR